jgi:putative endonuclease
MMYYTYVLKSKKDGKNYVGFTKNLKSRFDSHCKGLVPSTKDRRPLILIYYEACLDQNDATQREKYLKTIYGKRFIKGRIKSYLTGLTKGKTRKFRNLKKSPRRLFLLKLRLYFPQFVLDEVLSNQQ